MRKFNYNEPEFKVVMMASEDVIATSLDEVKDDWNTGTGSESGTVNPYDLFSV